MSNQRQRADHARRNGLIAAIAATLVLAATRPAAAAPVTLRFEAEITTLDSQNGFDPGLAISVGQTIAGQVAFDPFHQSIQTSMVLGDNGTLSRSWQDGLVAIAVNGVTLVGSNPYELLSANNMLVTDSIAPLQDQIQLAVQGFQQTSPVVATFDPAMSSLALSLAGVSDAFDAPGHPTDADDWNWLSMTRDLRINLVGNNPADSFGVQATIRSFAIAPEPASSWLCGSFLVLSMAMRRRLAHRVTRCVLITTVAATLVLVATHPAAAAPVTLQFEAEITNILHYGDPSSIPIDVQTGDPITVYSSTDWTIGGLRIDLGDLTLSSPHYAARIHDNAPAWVPLTGRIADPSSVPDIDRGPGGTSDVVTVSCIDNAQSVICLPTPVDADGAVTWAPRITLAGSDDSLNSTEWPSDLTDINNLPFREMSIRLTDVTSGHWIHIGGVVGGIQQVPEPASVALLLCAGVYSLQLLIRNCRVGRRTENGPGIYTS